MWDLIFERYMFFLMIFARMTGALLFNPFLNRKSVSVYIRMGLAFFCALLLTATMAVPVADFGNGMIFAVSCIKELFIGFFIGFILQLFLTVTLLSGEYVDLQLGIGMAKLYDPQSNISMPVTGSLFQLMYIVSFFAVNGHLTLLKIIFYSFTLLPPGPDLFNAAAWEYVVVLFSQILVLSLKLALPIIAIELVTEMGLGILMRAVPQLNVFVVGLQLKLLVGLILLVLVLPVIFGFMDTMLDQMFKDLIKGLRLLGG